MPIDFPSSPVTGSTYTYSGQVWTYSGSAWRITNANFTPGPTGATGPTGARGTTGTSFVWDSGGWTSFKLYNVNDVVEYQGSSYIFYDDFDYAVPANPPPSLTAHWQLMAQRGATGATGTGSGGVGATGTYIQVIVPVSGDYMAGHGLQYSNLSTSTGFMRCRPAFVPQGMTFTGLAVYVDGAGASGAVVRLGIYDADSRGRPNALILDAGTVQTTSNGAKVVTISQYLNAGKYYLAAVGQVQGCTLLSDQYLHFYNDTVFPNWDMSTWELSGITAGLPATWTSYTTRRGAAWRVLLKA